MDNVSEDILRTDHVFDVALFVPLLSLPAPCFLTVHCAHSRRFYSFISTRTENSLSRARSKRYIFHVIDADRCVFELTIKYSVECVGCWSREQNRICKQRLYACPSLSLSLPLSLSSSLPLSLLIVSASIPPCTALL